MKVSIVVRRVRDLEFCKSRSARRVWSIARKIDLRENYCGKIQLASVGKPYSSTEFVVGKK